MRTLIVNLIFFAAASISYAGSLTVISDSVGVEKIDGKLYVIHQVEEKETLYALSRRYGAAVNDIITANPLAENGLEIGQKIKVPIKSKAASVVINDKARYHTVAQGETLFSISRKFDVKVATLKKWNKLTNNKLEIGQRLIVGKRGGKSEANNIAKSDINVKSDKTYHTVKQSETLFSISRATGVSVEQLKKWNNLPNNSLSIGQQLIIDVKDNAKEIVEEVREESSEVVAEKEDDKDDPFKESRVEDGDEKTETTNDTKQPVKETNETSASTKKIETVKDNSSDFEEISDSGLAELIEGSSNTRKYLALHRTANIGTIMKVKNEMNGQEVFVRVLGKLPDTDINNNVLIKISKAAYNRLGAIDQKFRVSISYIP